MREQSLGRRGPRSGVEGTIGKEPRTADALEPVHPKEFRRLLDLERTKATAPAIEEDLFELEMPNEDKLSSPSKVSPVPPCSPSTLRSRVTWCPRAERLASCDVRVSTAISRSQEDFTWSTLITCAAT